MHGDRSNLGNYFLGEFVFVYCGFSKQCVPSVVLHTALSATFRETVFVSC